MARSGEPLAMSSLHKKHYVRDELVLLKLHEAFARTSLRIARSGPLNASDIVAYGRKAANVRL
jgi:hypothetical protein